MATPTIPNGEEQFFNILYEGNGAGQRVGKFVPFTDNGTIANSVIFNDADNAYLSRTNDAGDRDTFTISVWVKRCALGSVQYILDTYDGSSTNDGMIRFNTDNTMSIRLGSPSSLLYITNRTFEDTSKFYHIMLSVNTGESTAADRAKLYVDGDRITSFSTQTTSGSVNTQFNYSSATFRIGSTTSGSYDFDGYLAEFNQVDGTALTPDTFGLTDTSTGRWIPKALTGITYGTNGFRLQFGSSSALGDDTSGNENDFSVTNLVAGDQTTDSPTQNHATLQGTGGTLTEGNLTLDTGSSEFAHHNATLKPKSGKYYAEFTCNAMGRSEVGVASTTKLPYSANNVRLPATDDGSLAGYMWYGYNGEILTDSGSGNAGTYATYTTNDIISIALDLDNHTVQFFKNNSSVGTFGLPNSNYTFCMGDGATGYGGGWTANFGQKSFTYTPPTGFVALQQDNLPTTDKGVSGLVWIKSRDTASAHMLFDSSRGAQLRIKSDSTSSETTSQGTVTKFLKGGYAVGDQTSVNKSGDSVVAWNWVANSGTTATNNDGSVTSTVQANQTAGFSIVEFTTPSSTQDFTVGHGLSVAPRVFFFKRLDSTSGWAFYHQDVFDANGNQHTLFLNTTDASYAPNPGTAMYPSATTATTFSLRAGASIASSANCVAYCFNKVDGYSKFGKYVGNGSSDGPFIYTGFQPAMVLVKSYSNSATGWEIRDNKRSASGGNNPITQVLYPYLTSAEITTDNCDFLSNGFKWRSSGGNRNESGYTYIYMAWAEHPFVGDGTNPVTAR